MYCKTNKYVLNIQEKTESVLCKRTRKININVLDIQKKKTEYVLCESTIKIDINVLDIWKKKKLYYMKVQERLILMYLIFRKRQNLYYVKVQERLSTLDAGQDYIMTVTSISGNIKVSYK